MRLASRAAPAGPDRRASYAFAAVVALAVPLYLFLGRTQWFYNDEWDFLISRNAASFNDLVTPHNEHWSTLPILEYRLLWHVFGLRTYVPYQLPVIALHLLAAVLLWLLMKRTGVLPWLATLVASVFVLYGSGRQDIVWAFQVGFDGSLVLGLAQLLLADHDGPLDRRDAAGVACGVGALLCSGVGVTMVFVVGVATLLRRGWRVAAVHTLPLGIIYAAWWWTEGQDAFAHRLGSPGQIVGFVVRGIRNAFGHLGQLPGVGAVLLLVLAVGLVMAWGRLPFATFRRRAAVPVALLLGSVVFLTIAAIGRVAIFGSEFAQRSRYAHLTMAMFLPALAVALDAVVTRWRRLGYLVVPLLLVGVLGNLREVRKGNDGTPGVVVAMAHSPLAERVPRSDVPDQTYASPMTVGWLRDAAASGELPGTVHPSSDETSTATVRLSLQQVGGLLRPPGCEPLAKPVDRTLVKGDAVRWTDGRLSVELLKHGRASGSAIFLPEQGSTLRVRAPITVRITRATDGARLCGLSAASSSDAHVVAVPDGVSESVSIAAGKMTSLHLNFVVTRASSPTVAKGNLISQSPAAGTKVRTGTLVHLVASTGPSHQG